MKIKMKKLYKKAFTLAEILVTLSIIGLVLAALAPTVNTFNQERKDKTYKAQTGKAYSVLSEALRAKFVSTQQRMVGNSDASNLVNYIADSETVGTVKVINKASNGFKTQDGMVYAVRGTNCHKQACFLIVDMDGQDRGITQLSLDSMLANFNSYANASVDTAKDTKKGHSDIAVFMVKDGQVYPRSHYTAENMQMERNTDTSLATREIDIQFSELNLSQD